VGVCDIILPSAVALIISCNIVNLSISANCCAWNFTGHSTPSWPFTGFICSSVIICSFYLFLF